MSQKESSNFAIDAQAYYPGQAYNTPAMLQLAASININQGRLLDIGCGDGQLIKLLKERFPDIEMAGLTVSEDERRVCGEVFDVRVGDMHSLPWQETTFDVVISRHSLEHSISPLAALFEVNRVLRLDGVFHVVVPAPVSEWVIKWKDHFSVLHRQMWEKLFDDAGFAVEQYQDGTWLASFSMQPEAEMRFVLRKVRDVSSGRESSQHAEPIPRAKTPVASVPMLSTLVERRIVVVLHNLVLFDAIRPVVEHFSQDVKFLVPLTGDEAFDAMGERTCDGINAAGFKAERSALPTDIRCDIELSPYPYSSQNVTQAKWRVRFMYGLAKEAWNFSLENNAYYDFVLAYGDYDARVLSAYSTPVRVGNPKIQSVRRSAVLNARPVLLYLPTYGPTSSIEAVSGIQSQLKSRFRVIAKAHHGTTYLEPERTALLQTWVDELVHHDTNLSSLLASANVVLSDGSGAIFDAIAAEVPVAVFQETVLGGLGGTASLEERLVRDGLIPATNLVDNIPATLERALQAGSQPLAALRRELFAALGDEAAERAAEFLSELLAGAATYETFAVARRTLLAKIAEGGVQRQARQAAERQLDEAYRSLTDRLLADVQASLGRLSERDGQIASLKQEVVARDGQIDFLNEEISKIKQSSSWRVTSPLRATKNFVTAPKQTTYQILRSLFWRLPASLRQGLHGPRHSFVRFVRGLPTSSQAPCEHNSASADMADMSWSKFASEILSKREKYKGIFVQELVIDWNVPLYQRPQHIAAALGRLGYLVIYRTDNWAGDNVEGFREVSENVWITNRYEVEEIDDTVRSLYSTAYAHTPELLLKNGKRGTLIYEYIDHIDPEISGDSENIKRLSNLKKFAFEGGAEFIVASAKKLFDEAVSAVGKDKVLLVPNGVDTVHYRNPAHKRTALPDSLLEFKAKHQNIVGYFGALAPWLWYECIQELAAARPELGFVFIGPDYYGGAEKLPKCSNVLYLGTVDYKILPAYALKFDICFIPFKPGDIAKTTSPLKLFEYFALEKPVVVTADMNECTAFPEVFRGGSAAELSQALDAAIQVLDHEPFKVRLRELADQNDWTQRALAYEPVFSNINSKSLRDIQSMIVDHHRLDGDGKTYYEEAYMLQESLYWQPVPSWVDALSNINSAIDIGSAYGTLLTYTALNKMCQVLHAIDPVGYMSTSLRDRIGVNLHALDFEREDIVFDTKFDLVIFTEIIEHLNFHPLPTLHKLKRLMSPNGRLILTTPDAVEWGVITDFYPSLDAIPKYEGQDRPWIDGHIWQYTKEELDDLLLEAGFAIEKFDYSPGVAARHLCYQLKILDSESGESTESTILNRRTDI